MVGCSLTSETSSFTYFPRTAATIIDWKSCGAKGKYCCIYNKESVRLLRPHSGAAWVTTGRHVHASPAITASPNYDGTLRSTVIGLIMIV